MRRPKISFAILPALRRRRFLKNMASGYSPLGHRPDLVGKEEIKMKISARNQIPAKIVEVVKGAPTAHVKINIGGGTVVTASITNAAVDDLQLKAGGGGTIID